jgi:hypothetical protein
MSRFFKLSLVAAAAMAVGAADAALIRGDQNGGSSSAMFVAIDNANTISLTVDLGATLSSFLGAAGQNGVPAGFTFGAGSLSAPGTVAVWNFAANTYTVNGVAQSGTNNWSGIVGSFLTGVGSQYKWGVIASDAVAGATVSGSNVVARQNLLFTNGNPADFDTSTNGGFSPAAMANAASNLTQFAAASNSATGNTHAAGVRGANTATGGNEFLGTYMIGGVGNFGVDFATNDFLVAPGGISNFFWGHQSNPAQILSIGQTYSVGSLASNPSTFVWDAATSTLTYTVPVPEPGTYAMFLAGLAGVSFLVRRRLPK